MEDPIIWTNDDEGCTIIISGLTLRRGDSFTAEFVRTEDAEGRVVDGGMTAMDVERAEHP